MSPGSRSMFILHPVRSKRFIHHLVIWFINSLPGFVYPKSIKVMVNWLARRIDEQELNQLCKHTRVEVVTQKDNHTTNLRIICIWLLFLHELCIVSSNRSLVRWGDGTVVEQRFQSVRCSTHRLTFIFMHTGMWFLFRLVRQLTSVQCGNSTHCSPVPALFGRIWVWLKRWKNRQRFCRLENPRHSWRKISLLSLLLAWVPLETLLFIANNRVRCYPRSQTIVWSAQENRTYQPSPAAPFGS